MDGAEATRAMRDTLKDQSGVISRAQVLAAGLKPRDLERMVRRRELTWIHPRVYVDYAGSLTWGQRAWAAVLYAEPAALSHESAVRACEPAKIRDRFDPKATIHVAIASSRHLDAPAGVRVHRTEFFEQRVRDTSPPRIGYEDTIVDLAASARTDLDAIAQLANACGSKRTTASRLRAVVAGRRRLARRALLVPVLDDIESGTCSALEHAYLDRVVRPHGLPVGIRQASHRHAGDQCYRDVEHTDLCLVLELDGRLFHESVEARDNDLERDLDSAEDGTQTIRLAWGQCVERPCRTAIKVGRVMRRHGWTGSAVPCDACREAA